MATFLERALAEVLDTFGSGDSSVSSFSSFLVFFDLDYEFSFRMTLPTQLDDIQV